MGERDRARAKQKAPNNEKTGGKTKKGRCHDNTSLFVYLWVGFRSLPLVKVAGASFELSTSRLWALSETARPGNCFLVETARCCVIGLRLWKWDFRRFQPAPVTQTGASSFTRKETVIRQLTNRVCRFNWGLAFLSFSFLKAVEVKESSTSKTGT